MSNVSIPRDLLSHWAAVMDAAQARAASRVMNAATEQAHAQMIDALAQPEAQPEQQPVAWMVTDAEGRHFIFRMEKPAVSQGETLTPLYASPPVQAEPPPMCECGRVPGGHCVDLPAGTQVERWGPDCGLGKVAEHAAVAPEQAAQQGEPSDKAIRLADALEQGLYLVSDTEQKVRRDSASELRRLHAAVLALKPAGWIACSERMPESGRTVLATYLSRGGKRRRIRAQWIAAKTRQGDIEYTDLPLVYDEATDAFYVPEGWYEQVDNWDEYTSVMVTENEVTHWHELPPGPQPGDPT